MRRAFDKLCLLAVGVAIVASLVADAIKGSR